ncbi:MAG: hypothetical protein LBP26_01810 [Clostridiales bacterium]|nr:hypothetical protein [Clostridiales bacterium]
MYGGIDIIAGGFGLPDYGTEGAALAYFAAAAFFGAAFAALGFAYILRGPFRRGAGGVLLAVADFAVLAALTVMSLLIVFNAFPQSYASVKADGDAAAVELFGAAFKIPSLMPVIEYCRGAGGIFATAFAGGTALAFAVIRPVRTVKKAGGAAREARPGRFDSLGRARRMYTDAPEARDGYSLDTFTADLDEENLDGKLDGIEEAARKAVYGGGIDIAGPIAEDMWTEDLDFAEPVADNAWTDDLDFADAADGGVRPEHFDIVEAVGGGIGAAGFDAAAANTPTDGVENAVGGRDDFSFAETDGAFAGSAKSGMAAADNESASFSAQAESSIKRAASFSAQADNIDNESVLFSAQAESAVRREASYASRTDTVTERTAHGYAERPPRNGADESFLDGFIRRRADATQKPRIVTAAAPPSADMPPAVRSVILRANAAMTAAKAALQTSSASSKKTSTAKKRTYTKKSSVTVKSSTTKKSSSKRTSATAKSASASVKAASQKSASVKAASVRASQESASASVRTVGTVSAARTVVAVAQRRAVSGAAALFNDYLQSKSDEERSRLSESLNKITIK